MIRLVNLTKTYRMSGVSKTVVRNATMTSGIRTWRPIAARFDTVKTSTKGPKVV